MRIVFNNPVLYVVEYPQVDAVEVIDKRKGLGMLMRDETARRFRREFSDVVEVAEEADDFGDFIDQYEALMTQPAVYH
ncbi:MAG TPA: DUF3567 family protein [Rhodocyclaceae bacterium]|jgi:hypothetical protein|nr:DUF3567 family protein [Rhodocyclaceae bacterium]HMV55251.1 DUF3567 family protein [Rhodocyclaceae bacterium]HMZ84989.1 DUF3567 family protein [Rhodocyclaceae bacterium]HNA05091.1 DUF3567 family protein [Rhodocyclaceae bacterium]HNB77799.1 DUF3567 family protein [Rhodocyclaceae bacterium]